MGSTTRRPKNSPARRLIRRSLSSHYRRSRSLHNKSITASSRSSVSDKLQTLKNLIPAHELESDAAIGSTDELFQETADYILLLRTRVSILQKLFVVTRENLNMAVVLLLMLALILMAYGYGVVVENSFCEG
ncbi:hypothetical protein L2E82_19268 [Cichorium intybus]|uniref:Uncharacterized protein n=1 Tax=Cichorium intybus TaxID=13427 RepID=A0ACB9FCV1_CICIN|nr:hypothetical protein L2E82_19268 [Cichorium intybus]